MSNYYDVVYLLQCLEIDFLPCLLPLSLNAQALAMGGSKSKPKDAGHRTRSLDVNLSAGGGVGGHHLSSNQQSMVPNRSPTMDGGLGGNPSSANNAELSLFGGVDNNAVTSPNRITLAGQHNASVFFQSYMSWFIFFNSVPCKLSRSTRRCDDLRGVVRLRVSDSLGSVFQEGRTSPDSQQHVRTVTRPLMIFCASSFSHTHGNE